MGMDRRRESKERNVDDEERRAEKYSATYRYRGNYHNFFLKCGFSSLGRNNTLTQVSAIEEIIIVGIIFQLMLKL